MDYVEVVEVWVMGGMCLVLIVGVFGFWSEFVKVIYYVKNILYILVV